MDESIKMKLSKLIELLSNPDIKSKQAAFNACYGDLTQVKEIISWEKIVDIIKAETGVSFDARTASNMYGRSRRKFEISAPKITSKKAAPQHSDERVPSKIDEPNNTSSKKVNNPGDLRTLRNRTIDLDDLKNGD